MKAKAKAALRRAIEAVIDEHGATPEEAGDLLIDLAVDQACLETGWDASPKARALVAAAAGARMAEFAIELVFDEERRGIVAAAPNN